MTSSTCPPVGVPFCLGTPVEGDCINLSCVPACQGRRTCTADLDAGCLTCDNGAPVCTTPCSAALRGLGTVSETSCPGWSTGTTLQVLLDACVGTLHLDDGSPGTQLGRIFVLPNGTFLADLPSLGGACVGEPAPTGIEQWILNCPACSFVLALP